MSDSKTHLNGTHGQDRRVTNVYLKFPAAVRVEQALQELLECREAAAILAKHQCHFDVYYESHFYPDEFVQSASADAVAK